MAETLPIAPYKGALLEAIAAYPTLIVVGDTGSGKTTQIPQFLLESSSPGSQTKRQGKIAITQPRRIAALSAAKRVAEETQTELGQTIGYSIRFERVCGPSCRVLYMTDGTLLRAAAMTPNLQDFDIVILDEAHERSLETDILFGLLRRAQRARPSLKLIIMSATLDIDKFSSFFGDCPVFSIPGRLFSVDIYWQKKMKMAALKASYVQRAVETVMHIHKTERPGDILVFLTGQQEIETALRAVEDAHAELDYQRDVRYGSTVRSLVLYPIYSSLETLEQKAIFSASQDSRRKVVLSTNIAQTSVTVPGIRYVVDSGFVKQKMYDPKTHMDALVVVPVSQAAATQRAGRAGRTADGKVFRLYSRDAFEDMDPATVPEIQRSSLISTVLSLKKIGIEDVLNFEFIDPPDPDLITAAIKDLFFLGAVDEHGHLTDMGRQLAEFPISPYLSRSLVSSALDFHCSEEMITIAAMMSVEDVFMSPRSKKKQERADAMRARFNDPTGDHLTLLNVYEDWAADGRSKDWCFTNFIHQRAIRSADKVRDQLVDIMRRLKLPISRCPPLKKSRRMDPLPILRSLATAFYVHTAKRHPQRPYYYPYLSSVSSESSSSQNIMALYITPQSALSYHMTDSPPDWVIYNDIQYVSKAQMRTVSRIDFDMVRVLLGRVKLMDVEKLTGTHVQDGKPKWADDDLGSSQSSVPTTKDASLEFEKVHEVIDEQHHTELAHIGDKDVPLESHKKDIAAANHEEEERERERKKAEYRERFLKRKR